MFVCIVIRVKSLMCNECLVGNRLRRCGKNKVCILNIYWHLLVKILHTVYSSYVINNRLLTLSYTQYKTHYSPYNVLKPYLCLRESQMKTDSGHLCWMIGKHVNFEKYISCLLTLYTITLSSRQNFCECLDFFI